MSRKKERNKGTDHDLEKYLNETELPVASDPADTDELEKYIETPLLDERKQKEVEAEQRGAAPIKRERLQTLDDQQVPLKTTLQAQQTPLAKLAGNVTQPLVNGSKQALNNVSNASTSGGIGTLIVIIVVLLFILVQVDQQGNTRFKMLWYMLNGRAQLDQRVTPQTPSASPLNNATQPAAPQNRDGSCPDGYVLMNGICQSTAGI